MLLRGRRMSAILLRIIIVTSVMASCGHVSAQSTELHPQELVTLAPQHEFGKTHLLGISADGKTALVWKWGRSRGYVAAIRMDSEEMTNKTADMVTHPLNSFTIPASGEFSYLELDFIERANHRMLWNFDDGPAPRDLCPGSVLLRHGDFQPIDEYVWVGIARTRAGEPYSLVKIRLADCSIIKSVAPDDKHVTTSGIRQLRISPTGTKVAYIIDRGVARGNLIVSERDIWIRDTATLDVLARIRPVKSWNYGSLAWSPDEKQLLAAAYNKGLQRGCHVFVFRSEDGIHLRSWDTAGCTSLAISMDGFFFATARTEIQPQGRWFLRRGIVDLYDVETGAEVAVAHLPWQKGDSDVEIDLVPIAFTADGKYVIASGGDMIVWELPEAAQLRGRRAETAAAQGDK